MSSGPLPFRLSRRRLLTLIAAAAATPPGQWLAAREAPRNPPPGGNGDRLEHRFQESAESFANPERGFYAQRRSDRMDRLEDLRAQGISLLLVTLDLRGFKDRALDAAKLDELRQALTASRNGGYKVIFRTAYGFTKEDYRADPADLGRITGHIDQIGGVLTENRDILCGIQAGMLGPWGEWHSSNHGNPPSLASRRAVLFGWLDAVPAPVTVHVRRPMFIRDIFASEPGGSDLGEDRAYDGSRLSRTGWHNDALLVPPGDLGTYAEPGWNRARELDWCSRHGRFTPFGGETVHTATPLPIPAVIRELELLHATYLNIGYHPRVLQRWRETAHAGETTFEHIARRLGYRFVARRLDCARRLRLGGTLEFELTVRNVGFASPHLPRVTEAALFHAGRGTPASRVLIPPADVRWWSPERGDLAVRAALPVPANVRGPCRLALRFADPVEHLRDDGRYAIRLANDDITFTPDGWNILAGGLAVDS